MTWARKTGNSRPVTNRSRRRMASAVIHGPHRGSSAAGPASPAGTVDGVAVTVATSP